VAVEGEERGREVGFFMRGRMVIDLDTSDRLG
jgi:hypothetical protein